MSRKIVLYIAMSLDGYIAKTDGNIDFLSIVDSSGEDYGYKEFTSSVSTVIWGRKTYDKILSFGIDIPHNDKEVYVISKNKTGKEKHVQFHSNVIELINNLKKKEGKNIYCDGGAEIVFEILNHKLFDQIIISVIPHLLGDGIKLFKSGFPEQNLQFKKSVSFPSGLVQLWYNVVK